MKKHFTPTFLLGFICSSLLAISCNDPQKADTTETRNDTTVTTPATDSSVVSGVVDFRATGNEPFWLLEIANHGNLKFQMLGGDSLEVPTPQRVRINDSLATSYRVQTSSGLLNVMVYDKMCINDMSGDTLPKTVEVRLNDQKYKGCGRFLRE
jgi:uncharacterized membrane protein